VDAIVGCSSSALLLRYIIKVAGDTVNQAYTQEIKNYPNSILISTPAGHLPCKRVFFLKWSPDKDDNILRQSVIDFVSNSVQNALAHNFTSIAFPAIGCGQHGCSIGIVVKTLVREAKNQLTIRNIPLKILFIIEEDKQNIYDEFCKQVVALQALPVSTTTHQLPETWEHSPTANNTIRFKLNINTKEYQSVFNEFDKTMKGKYTEIIQMERIQNERQYLQYLVHRSEFKKRLNIETEKLLYHGCPDTAAIAISEDCFNRSFAGVNGTSYGFGVYFSSQPTYSHT
ncbi:unnamed protein product, partial [Didymodactylos carnosus]